MGRGGAESGSGGGAGLDGRGGRGGGVGEDGIGIGSAGGIGGSSGTVSAAEHVLFADSGAVAVPSDVLLHCVAGVDREANARFSSSDVKSIASPSALAIEDRSSSVKTMCNRSIIQALKPAARSQ